MNSLQQRLEDHRVEHRWSYADVARRCGLPEQTVRNVVKEPMRRAPKPERLRQIAVGWELPLDVVRQWAAEAFELHVYDDRRDPDLTVIIAQLEELSPERRRMVAGLIEGMYREEQAKRRLHRKGAGKDAGKAGGRGARRAGGRVAGGTAGKPAPQN